MAGAALQREREDVLARLEQHAGQNFMVLFRNEKGMRGLNFRALYSYNIDTGEVMRMYGNGPTSIDESMVELFFKYDSGAKEFKPLPSKKFSVTTDAIALFPAFYPQRAHSRPTL
mmetsp:Transcript_7810/g.12496  ORF Transcript_7810/g.12496 Transcript_7810/m.12496 type:complete len:115 (+) Transcript_7810:1505-1849(+)